MPTDIVRFSYQSGDYVPCPTGWNDACYDVHGSYIVSATFVYNLIQNAGWRGDDAWMALAICYHESSFMPDVEAICPPGI